jgi:hypothetical protein
MRHLIACRFSVPRLEPESATRHADPEWLESRLALFRSYFAPSVGRLGVPVVLLCSSASAAFVAEKTRQFPWARVEEQDDWRGGPTGFADLVVTRLDSDDALAADWFSAVEMAPRSSKFASPASFSGSTRAAIAGGLSTPTAGASPRPSPRSAAISIRSPTITPRSTGTTGATTSRGAISCRWRTAAT